MSIRVHIADDHNIFRDGLRSFLDRAGGITIVGETGDGFQTLRWFAENEADILLLDLNMPGLGGAAVADSLVDSHPAIGICVLTMHDDEFYLKEMLKKGCKGFVLKTSSGQELVRAIHSIHAGQPYVDPALSKYLLGTVQPEKAPAQATARLTRREVEVCRLLALGHTNEEVASQLCLSPRTVETHRSSIMSKLELKNRAGLVRWAIENGVLKTS